MYQNNTNGYNPIKGSVTKGLAGLVGLALLAAGCGKQEKNITPETVKPQYSDTQPAHGTKPGSIQGKFMTWEGYIDNTYVSIVTEGILLKNDAKTGGNVLLPTKHTFDVYDSSGAVLRYIKDESTVYDAKVEEIWNRTFAGLEKIVVSGPAGNIGSYDLKVDWKSADPKPTFQYVDATGNRYDQNNAPDDIKAGLNRFVGVFRNIKPELEKVLEERLVIDAYKIPILPEKPVLHENKPQKPLENSRKVLI